MSANLIRVSPDHFQQLISWRGHTCEPTRGNGGLYKIDGFTAYNQLLTINEIFSTQPKHLPVDRTLNVTVPLKVKIRRPWQAPNKELDFFSALQQRVHDIEQKWPNQIINVFWSGGVDSTTAVTAFLLNLSDRSRLRILYSPYSVYEHPEYLKFLQKNFSNIDLVDISGDVYLNQKWDGIFVTGDSGDEMHASLDQSFFEQHGYQSLNQNWKDFFYAQNSNDNFINFCEQYFARSGLEIRTVLEARWWYYINSKLNCMLFYKLVYWLDYDNFNFDCVQGFFDCEQYESYIAYNLDKIMPDSNYQSWKSQLKNYCYSFDKIENWWKNKKKVNSSQLHFYIDKKIILKNLQFIYVLDNGQRIHTPNLPWLSRHEFDNKYGTTLDYLWNEPDKF